MKKTPVRHFDDIIWYPPLIQSGEDGALHFNLLIMLLVLEYSPIKYKVYASRIIQSINKKDEQVRT